MVHVRAVDAPATCITVDYEWKACVAWKSEYTQATCEDRYRAEPEHGLFALADGLGMMSNAALWAQLLVDQWVDEPPMITMPGFMTSGARDAAAGDDSDAYSVDTGERETGAQSETLFQFEVEHWLRRTQQQYNSQAPTVDERTALPETKQKARLGSGATFLAATLQPDLLATGTASLQVMCYARGDTTAFLISQGLTTPELTIRTFPITDPGQYTTYTTCLRSKSFDRKSEGLQFWRNSVPVGDILLLATDAVAKCLFGLLAAHAGATLTEFGAFSEEAWRERVTALRAKGELVDDDSSYIMIRLLPAGTGSATPGWERATLSERTLRDDYARWGQRRREEARAALARDDIRELARIVGAGVFFQGGPYMEYRSAAARGRRVTLAMERFFLGLSGSSGSAAPPGSAPQVAALRTLWRETAPVLAHEPAAGALRQTLAELGVISTEGFDPQAQDGIQTAQETGSMDGPGGDERAGDPDTMSGNAVTQAARPTHEEV